LLHGLYFIRFGIWNLDAKFLGEEVRIDRQAEDMKNTPTSSTAMTTSTESKLSRPRSVENDELAVT
jgi:hypothetical protein